CRCPSRSGSVKSGAASDRSCAPRSAAEAPSAATRSPRSSASGRPSAAASAARSMASAWRRRSVARTGMQVSPRQSPWGFSSQPSAARTASGVSNTASAAIVAAVATGWPSSRSVKSPMPPCTSAGPTKANPRTLCYTKAMRRWVGPLVLLAVVAAGGATAADQAPPASTGPGPSGPARDVGLKPIPVPQLPARAEDTQAHLRAIDAASLPLQTVTAIEHRLPDLEKSVASGMEETYRVIKENPSLAALDELLDPWANARDQA